MRNRPMTKWERYSYRAKNTIANLIAWFIAGVFVVGAFLLAWGVTVGTFVITYALKMAFLAALVVVVLYLMGFIDVDRLVALGDAAKRMW